MDDVLRRAGSSGRTIAAQPLAPSGADQARAEQPGTPPESTPPATPPPPPTLASAARQQPSRESRKTEPLTTTVASVRSVGYQRLLVTTADGSAWEQTEAEAFLTPPKAGDTFSVEPAAMNSFRCRFNQSSLYRCRPVN